MTKRRQKHLQNEQDCLEKSGLNSKTHLIARIPVMCCIFKYTTFLPFFLKDKSIFENKRKFSQTDVNSSITKKTAKLSKKFRNGILSVITLFLFHLHLKYLFHPNVLSFLQTKLPFNIGFNKLID
jgi:hypothetical protein